MIFEEYASCHIILIDLVVWLPLLREILSNMCIVNCNFLLTRLWCHTFWNWHFLEIKLFAVFPAWTKSKEKIFNILRNKKHFSSLVKYFYWSKTFLGSWESKFKVILRSHSFCVCALAHNVLQLPFFFFLRLRFNA